MTSFEDRTYLTGEEARFLTLALQQVIEVSKRFEKYPGMLIQPSSNKFFIRAPVKHGDSISWMDEWHYPLLPESEDFPHVDKTLLNRLKKANFSRERYGKWISFMCLLLYGKSGKDHIIRI